MEQRKKNVISKAMNHTQHGQTPVAYSTIRQCCINREDVDKIGPYRRKLTSQIAVG
jgi:hypothetical protein